MSETISFHPETGLGKALQRWWSGFENDRGSRAELRRAHDLTALILTPAYQRFYRYLLGAGWPYESEDAKNERLAAIAGLAAHIEKMDERPLPEAFSTGEKPPFSELRFRRLLESSSIEELFTGLRRALPLIGKQANLFELANDVLFWGDSVKKRWAYRYQWPL